MNYKYLKILSYTFQLKVKNSAYFKKPQETPAVSAEEVFVFQCPATIKGGRQCAELAMEEKTLMVHWGSQVTANQSPVLH